MYRMIKTRSFRSMIYTLKVTSSVLNTQTDLRRPWTTQRSREWRGGKNLHVTHTLQYLSLSRRINGCERDVINKQTNQINNAQIGLHCPICWNHADYFYIYTDIHTPLNFQDKVCRLYALNTDHHYRPNLAVWTSYHFYTCLALGATQLPTQSLLADLSLGTKRTKREAQLSHPSSTEVKNECSYTSTPPQVFLACTTTLHIHTYRPIRTQACFYQHNT